MVTLWWTSVSAALPFLSFARGLLDAEEGRRADRFTVAGGKARYLTAHGMLRIVLGRALATAPSELRFQTGARGKPSLRAPTTLPTPHFNISHSGDVAVVALAGAELGVDVEALRPLARAERLAARFFSDRERQSLAEVSSESRDTAFLGIWTAKEAYLKAVGSGVAMPLRKIEIDLSGPVITRIMGDPHAASRWSLLHTALPIPAVCTVAIRGRGWRLDVRRFDWNQVHSQSPKSKV